MRVCNRFITAAKEVVFSLCLFVC